MPAHDLETLVIDGVRAFLADASRVHDAVAALAPDGDRLAATLALAAARAADPDPSACRALIERVEVRDVHIDIDIAMAGLTLSNDVPATPATAPTALRITLPTVRLRRGKEVRLLIPGADGGLQASPDPALIKLLANAFAGRDAVDAASEAMTLVDVARMLGYSLEYFSLLLRLSMLAPDIVAAIHDGRQPPSLNRQRLARTTSLPVDWPTQRSALGFV